MAELVPRLAVASLIRDALSAGVPRVAYRHYLLNIVEPWLARDASDPATQALPVLTCLAAGGDAVHAAPAAAAWQLVRLAAKCLDDVEDGDVPGVEATAINAGVGLLCAAQLALRGLPERGLAGVHVRHLQAALAGAVLQACAGQHEDLSGAVLDPDAWQEVAASKSGALLAWACWAGGVVAGAGERALASFRSYGRHLGILLQVADDYSGVWCARDAIDLAAGRLTLPVSYALLTAEAGQRERLLVLLGAARRGDGAAEAQARQMLEDLGAQAYLRVVANVQRQHALAALREAGGSGPAGQELAAVLERVLPR